ncbi:MAG: 3'(2'),5'-bisphosphate nucleotidase CysQ [Pseudomonadota bacterium]
MVRTVELKNVHALIGSRPRGAQGHRGGASYRPMLALTQRSAYESPIIEPGRNAVEEIATEIRRLALEAGRAIIAIYESDDFGTREKDDASPVTEADLAADDIIAAGLAAAFPDIPVVTEERAESQEGPAPDRFFLVDPLDGTKEFVQRRGDFTVNIALIEEGRPRLGIVLAPARQRLWRSLAEGGAEEEALDDLVHPVPDSARPITVREAEAEALVVVASKSHGNKATEDYIKRYAPKESRNAGSSLKFCLVAAGEADFYPRLGRTMEWDTAAGHAVLLAAGGDVRTLEHLRPLAYGKPGWENPHFIAYGAGVPVEEA